ncbi:tetratricopeptide repeat protein [Nannocystis pusilla]|uniref:tetratricopeptide repeat protein n=1 Tax=Nannocystis pusilla TaxID=889268 RepID=UPI003B78CCCD
MAALTSSRRGHLLAYQLGRPDQARAELRLIAALNRVVAEDGEIYGEYLNVAGAIHAQAGNWTAAGAEWEEAVALREAHDRLATPLGIGILYNLGAQLLIVGQYEAAAVRFRRVLELSERISGPNHPDRAMYESTLAYALTGLGRTREALARMRELEASVSGSENKVTRTTILVGLGQAELALNDGRAAMQHFVAAQRTSPESFSSRGWVLLMRAAAAAETCRRWRRRATRRSRGSTSTPMSAA